MGDSPRFFTHFVTLRTRPRGSISEPAGGSTFTPDDLLDPGNPDFRPEPARWTREREHHFSQIFGGDRSAVRAGVLGTAPKRNPPPARLCRLQGRNPLRGSRQIPGPAPWRVRIAHRLRPFQPSAQEPARAASIVMPNTRQAGATRPASSISGLIDAPAALDYDLVIRPGGAPRDRRTFRRLTSPGRWESIGPLDARDALALRLIACRPPGPHAEARRSTASPGTVMLCETLARGVPCSAPLSRVLRDAKDRGRPFSRSRTSRSRISTRKPKT